jgi:hypothetical protein
MKCWLGCVELYQFAAFTILKSAALEERKNITQSSEATEKCISLFKLEREKKASRGISGFSACCIFPSHSRDNR